MTTHEKNNNVAAVNLWPKLAMIYMAVLFISTMVLDAGGGWKQYAAKLLVFVFGCAIPYGIGILSGWAQAGQCEDAELVSATLQLMDARGRIQELQRQNEILVQSANAMARVMAGELAPAL